MIAITQIIKWVYTLIWVSCLAVLYTQGQPTTETRISVSAPLNPVKDGDMLSIHCKIWNLENDHSVIIQRSVRGETQIIAFDETIKDDVDNRFFLAQRRLGGGQVVFFLSIIDVKRVEDEGEYECKVIVKRSLLPVVNGSVLAKVYFFPSEPSPECFPKVAGPVKSGTEISFNCTSQDGFPVVDMEWKKTGSDNLFKSTTKWHENGIAYSRLTLVASMRYNEAVFICMISSNAFPSITPRTCHVGPLTVIPDPLNPEPDMSELDNRENERTKPGGSLQHPISNPGKSDVVHERESSSADCSEVCSSLSSSAFYWIIATIVAGGLAIIFLIIGVIIAIKLCHMPEQQTREAIDQTIYRQPLEDVYERLECSRDGNRMYMALHGLRKPDNLVVQTHIPVEIEGNYTRTPTAPVSIPGASTDRHPPVPLRPITPDKLL